MNKSFCFPLGTQVSQDLAGLCSGSAVDADLLIRDVASRDPIAPLGKMDLDKQVKRIQGSTVWRKEHRARELGAH